MKLLVQKYGLLLVILGLFSVSVHAQFTIPEKPKNIKDQTSLYDYSNLLVQKQKKALEQKLIKYSDSTSTQIVIIIINSTQGEDISLLGAKWGQKWGIGQKIEDNGILILLAKNDRKIDINTGYGIEYRITDLMAERIINRIMIPEFKKGLYYTGLDKGTDAIFQALNGEFKENRDFNNQQFPISRIIILFIIFMILLIILTNNKNNKNNRGRRSSTGSLLDTIILSNMGRTGGYGGSSSGGSFGGGGFGGGFGGGGFGGGGASGGW
ncbi:MAG: TPM domain-containing protein [Flavobacteriales bacterium]